LSVASNVHSRIAVSRSPEALRIEVRFPHSPVWIVSRIVVLLILSVGTYGGFVTVVDGYPNSHGVALAVLLLLGCAIFIFVSAVILETLLRLFGRETIVLENDRLALTTELFGIQYAQSFLVAEVAKFRLLEDRYERRGRSRWLRKIAFDYRGRSIATRGNLSRQEGQLLYELLASHFSEPEALAPWTGAEPADQIPE